MKAALAAGAVPYIGACTTANCPDGKVRLACVGIGQQAWNDIREFEKTGLVQIAALCDTDLDGKQCVAALKQYPNVPRFRDFRKMLDAMDGKIDAVAQHLADNANRVVIVEGNCDDRGSNEYNMSLGENRAVIIRNYLVQNGVAADRIQTRSNGEEKPAVEGQGESVWSKNRRGEFAIFQK